MIWYDMALAQSVTMTKELKELFVKLDFEREEVKTLSFNVSTEYESYQAKLFTLLDIRLFDQKYPK